MGKLIKFILFKTTKNPQYVLHLKRIYSFLSLLFVSLSLQSSQLLFLLLGTPKAGWYAKKQIKKKGENEAEKERSAVHKIIRDYYTALISGFFLRVQKVAHKHIKCIFCDFVCRAINCTAVCYTPAGTRHPRCGPVLPTQRPSWRPSQGRRRWPTTRNRPPAMTSAENFFARRQTASTQQRRGGCPPILDQLHQVSQSNAIFGSIVDPDLIASETFSWNRNYLFQIRKE